MFLVSVFAAGVVQVPLRNAEMSMALVDFAILLECVCTGINAALLQSASALHEHAIPEMEELYPKTGSRHRPRWEC